MIGLGLLGAYARFGLHSLQSIFRQHYYDTTNCRPPAVPSLTQALPSLDESLSIPKLDKFDGSLFVDMSLLPRSE
jgi:hypothetical protein